MGTPSHYDVDFYQWTLEQAALLRGMPRESCPLDVDHLAEEVEDMGRSEIRELSSLLRQTIVHLLKITLDPEAPAVGHWLDEAIAFQGDAVLAFFPGLRQRLDLDTIWRVACNGARHSLAAHGVAVPPLPASCPLALNDLLDPDFNPAGAVKILAGALGKAKVGSDAKI